MKELKKIDFFYIKEKVKLIFFSNRNINLVILIESIILAIFQALGNELNKNGNVRFDEINLYFSIIFWMFIIYIGLHILYSLLKYCESIKPKHSENEVKETTFLKKYLLIFLIIFICWIPLFLAVFPGYYCYDVKQQYEMVANWELLQHHPILHTLILGGIVHIFYLITNSYNVGIALYNILQMILIAGIFTYSIYFMKKYNVPKILRIIAILYYSLFPTIQMFAMCSTKDSLFTAITLLLIMTLIDLFINTNEFIKFKRNLIKLGVLIFLFCALRNNAIYAMVVFLVVFAFLPRGTRKVVFKVSIISILAYIIILTVFSIIFNVEKISFGEMFSVPIQQLGYVYKNSYDELTEDEIRIMNEIIIDNVWDTYNPELSDPLKENFETKVFLKNIKTYIILGIKHPSDYINAFLINTKGYWHPNTIIDGYNNGGNNYYVTDNSKTCYFAAKVDKPGTQKSFIPILRDIYFDISRNGILEQIPGVSILFSIGGNFWLFCITVGYCLYRKRYKIVYPLILIFLLWGTVLLGPITLVRYILILFFSFPVLLSILFSNNDFAGNHKI